MIRLFIILTLMITVLSGTSIGQSTASPLPSPTPKPATRRPTPDQFGLSSGVFANSDNAEPVTKVEYIDVDTFETLSQIIEKSAFMEAELLRVLRDNIDISPSSRFRKYFEHHIVGIMHVSEVERTGRFGGSGIKSGEITKLLQQNEKTVLEIVAVLDAGPAEYARFNKELNGVSEKYGVLLLEGTSGGNRLDKPALLKVMMSRLNGNFVRLKKQMAVGK